MGVKSHAVHEKFQKRGEMDDFIYNGVYIETSKNSKKGIKIPQLRKQQSKNGSKKGGMTLYTSFKDVN
ncbi:hypothetical protein LJB90_03570 [Eubacteriales bacterium OttesenSCG-928-G02]|nr:hypothetical protein [Eubacteriales bacterium OttesenSCG-928-G02]